MHYRYKATHLHQEFPDLPNVAAVCVYPNMVKTASNEVDKSEKGLGIRSNRYTMLVENGEVKKVEVEKETASCELSSAESFLKSI